MMDPHNQQIPHFHPNDSHTPFRVMFVCLGNICRSPAAQGVMESVICEQGLASKWMIDSAGTASYHTGRPPDHRMVAAAANRGIRLTSVAKTLTAQHLVDRDLIVAMDRENLANIRRLSTQRLDHVKLLSDFLDKAWPRDVPDPYYGEDEGFEFVLDMLTTACPQIVAALNGER